MQNDTPPHEALPGTDEAGASLQAGAAQPDRSEAPTAPMPAGDPAWDDLAMNAPCL